MAAYGKFFFRPAKGEHITAEIRPEPDDRAVISGHVTDLRGRAAEDAVLLLYRVNDGAPADLIGRTCTDEDGVFIFGPLEGGRLYLVKVFREGAPPRELELQVE